MKKYNINFVYNKNGKCLDDILVGVLKTEISKNINKMILKNDDCELLSDCTYLSCKE